MFSGVMLYCQKYVLFQYYGIMCAVKSEQWLASLIFWFVRFVSVVDEAIGMATSAVGVAVDGVRLSSDLA